MLRGKTSFQSQKEATKLLETFISAVCSLDLKQLGFFFKVQCWVVFMAVISAVT